MCVHTGTRTRRPLVAHYRGQPQGVRIPLAGAARTRVLMRVVGGTLPSSMQSSADVCGGFAQVLNSEDDYAAAVRGGQRLPRAQDLGYPSGESPRASTPPPARPIPQAPRALYRRRLLTVLMVC